MSAALLLVSSLAGPVEAQAVTKPAVKLVGSYRAQVVASTVMTVSGRVTGLRGPSTAVLESRVARGPWRAGTHATVRRSRFALRWLAPAGAAVVRLRVAVRQHGRLKARGRTLIFTVVAPLTNPGVVGALSVVSPSRPSLTPPALITVTPAAAPTEQTIVSDGRQAITLQVGRVWVNAPADAVRPGQTLTLSATPVAAFPATGVPSVGGAFQLTTSQGEPDAPITIGYVYDAAQFPAGQHPLLLHGDESYGVWEPEPTSYDQAQHLAWATVDQLSPMDWANDVVYFSGKVLGDRMDLPDDCGDAPDWVKNVSLPVSKEQPFNVCFSEEGSMSAQLHVVNNRGYAQEITVSGIGFDVDDSSWGDGLDRDVADAFAKLASTAAHQTFILGPQQDAHLEIERPADAPAATEVTIDPQALNGNGPAAAMGYAVLHTAQAQIGSLPRSIVDCVIGAVANESSLSSSGVLSTMRSCANAPSALSSKAKALFKKIDYGLAVDDFFFQLQDRMADGVYPTQIGFTIPGTGLTSAAIKVGPYDLGTVPSGQPFTKQLSATGGTAPYRFRLSTGTTASNGRPAWASVSPSGLLTLNPPAADDQAYTMYVYVVDAEGRHSPTARDAITFHTGGPAGPADPDPQVRYTTISAGTDHACGSTTTGHVHCWGHGAAGKLGDGAITDQTAPVNVIGLDDAIQVSAGGFSTCALRAGGTVACWGNNTSGQLGDGGTTDSWTPVAVSGLTDAVAVDVGYTHACALRADTSVACWGDGNWGQLGDGAATSSTVPVPVPGLAGATSVQAGMFMSCATREVGPPLCWGNNGSYRLGNGSRADAHTPTPVVGLDGAVAVDVSGIDGGYGCGARAGGGVSCWGFESDVFDNSYIVWGSATATSLGGVGDAVAITTGNQHACVVHAVGTMSCWGRDESGELGNGSAINSVTPVAVSGLGDATTASAGFGFTCALHDSGQVLCWGNNHNGQLGIDSTSDASTPVLVSG